MNVDIVEFLVSLENTLSNLEKQIAEADRRLAMLQAEQKILLEDIAKIVNAMKGK
jgi:hypothetical protein